MLHDDTLKISKFWFFLGLAWILLFIIKVFNGIVLLGKACEHVNEYRDIQAKVEFELYRKRVLMMKSKSAPSSPRISLVDFSGTFVVFKTLIPFCCFCFPSFTTRFRCSSSNFYSQGFHSIRSNGSLG